MNDEAAEPRVPSGPSQDVPASAATTPSAPAASAQTAGEPPTADLRAGAVPDDAPPAPGNSPPWFPPGEGADAGATFGSAFSRDKLVRPRQGRYLAGVCGALARATNTDPVLWRVLFAVLGVLSGVGVLLYLIGWLVMPAEDDSASPIESLLGKGRSGMAPTSVILLGGAAVLSFAFIVQDGMRASLLACAVILGAILLIKRSGTNQQSGAAAFPPPPPGPFQPGAFDQTAQFGAVPPTVPPTAPAAPPADPVTPPPPPYAPPASSGYRPPFAPHGPYARPTPVTYPPGPPVPPVMPRPAKPPKPPRERSKLGRLTFFAVIMVVGLMVAIDMAGAGIAVSAYFAAALATVALGLIVGAWFGRARGLIALGLLISIGLLASSGAERWGSEVGNSVYRPASLNAVADRYDFTAGNATLDLRQVDFTGQEQTVVVTMKIGQIRVLLPEKVDTTATLRVDNGRAVIFGKEFNDREVDGQNLTDLGTDGAGGGTLKLDLQLDTGNMEVTR